MNMQYQISDWLPTTPKEAKLRGWDEVDVVLFSGDAYTPGGKPGFRPDYTTEVYSQIIKKLYPEVPLVIGGIEASLRRVTHYDYWQDRLKPSLLESTGVVKDWSPPWTVPCTFVAEAR